MENFFILRDQVSAVLTTGQFDNETLALMITGAMSFILGIGLTLWLYQKSGWQKELIKTKSDLDQRLIEKEEIYVQMSRQKTLMDTLLHNMPLAIFAKDAKNDYRMVMLNKTAEEYFCLKASETIGKSDYDFFPKEEADFFRETDIKVMEGGKLVEIEAEPVTTPKGTFMAHTLKVPIYDEEGNPSLLLGILENVTEKIKSQEDLKKAKNQAEQASRAKGEFLANMSHEIRTPMNGILGLTRLLSDMQLTKDQSELVNAILLSGESLLLLLNDILDFSKMEANELILEKAPFNVQSSLKNVVNLLGPMASKKGLIIEYAFDPNTPTTIIGDSMRLNQIVTNLLGNAIKFTQEGKVKLSVNADCKEGDNYLFSFKIEDTGVGIPESFHETLFKKFSQSDTSISRKYGGTGLGLAISKELTDLMHGDITFISKLNQGTTFTVTIPFQKASEEIIANHKNQVSHIGKDADEFSRFHVMIVDDHPVNLLFINKMLQKIGFKEIDQATNGVEALTLWVTSPKEYDIVLMDCQMPEIDGLEATRMIRTREMKKSLRHVPIVAMTAHAMEGDREKCLQAGMDDYLSKPINPDALYSALQRWLLVKKEEMPATQKNNIALAEEVTIVDLQHLGMFTDGDLEQEKELSSIFISKGMESLDVLKMHLLGKATADDWRNAAHKLKGSAAQMGANLLSEACLAAEKQRGADIPEKEKLYAVIDTTFVQVKDFFETRKNP